MKTVYKTQIFSALAIIVLSTVSVLGFAEEQAQPAGQAEFTSSASVRPGLFLINSSSGIDLSAVYKKKALIAALPEFLSRERLGFGAQWKKASKTNSSIAALDFFAELEFKEMFNPIFSALPFYTYVPFYISTQFGFVRTEKVLGAVTTNGVGVHFAPQLHIPLPTKKLHPRLESEVLFVYAIEAVSPSLFGVTTSLNLGFLF